MEHTATKNSRTVFHLETQIQICIFFFFLHLTISDCKSIGAATSRKLIILEPLNKLSRARQKLLSFILPISLLPTSQNCLNGYGLNHSDLVHRLASCTSKNNINDIFPLSLRFLD